MLMFSKQNYEKYCATITSTDYHSMSSLSMGVFTSYFYHEDMSYEERSTNIIKISRGEIENRRRH